MVDISDIRPGMRVRLVAPEKSRWLKDMEVSKPFLGKVVTVKKVEPHPSAPPPSVLHPYILIEECEKPFYFWSWTIEEIVNDSDLDDEVVCTKLVFDIADLYGAQ